MSNIPITASTILLVDDNRANLGLLYRMLHSSGYRVLIAEDGSSGCTIAGKDPPDVILLDIMLPDYSGYEICRRLKNNESTADIPVLFISALSELKDKLEGFKSGGVDFITKPFHTDEVLARIHTQLTLVHQRRMLEEVNATKDRLLSIIAHDIRGPISGFIGVATVIEETVRSGNTDSLLDVASAIRNSAQSTYEMLENLLQWARSSQQHQGLQLSTVSIQPLADRVTGVVASMAEQKSIDIQQENLAGVSITADEQQLETMIRNLASNALKFCNSGDRITISYSQTDKMHRLSVRDTGIGMNEQQIQDLFRIDSTSRRRGTSGERGSGFGLILVKEYIDKHSGRMEVHSTPGEGSEFVLLFPRQQPESMPRPQGRGAETNS